MEPYVGIAVFELSKSETATQEAKSFFREDFYIVYAQNDNEAQRKVKALAHEQESEPGGMSPLITLRHIVDVAPALYGYVDQDCDLYSRHFNSLEDYKKFEIKLGGTNPLQTDIPQ